MEVHHHSHTERKKWTHYFWEFLMLFLAVFCGFLAEYQLEHTIEHQREKQYVRSLIADLENDQKILAKHMEHLQTGISRMDSVIAILNDPSSITVNTGNLYYLGRIAPRLNPLANNSRTFEQLKSSGNFRLIGDIGTSNMIMDYYEKFPTIRLLESSNEIEFNEYKKIASKVFDPAVFISMEDDNGQIKRTNENLPLRTTDKETLQQLSVFAVYMRGTKIGILKSSETLMTSGSELIKYLKEEYHLK